MRGTIKKPWRQGGFTLVELMLSTLLLGVLAATLWGLFGNSVLLWRQTLAKADVSDNIRFAMNRLVREIKCADSIAGGSDVSRITFTNGKGDSVSYYCLGSQLLRRENGMTAPLASHITGIEFSYLTGKGLIIDHTNYEEAKLSSNWPASLTMVSVTVVGSRPGSLLEEATITQKINLRTLP